MVFTDLHPVLTIPTIDFPSSACMCYIGNPPPPISLNKASDTFKKSSRVSTFFLIFALCIIQLFCSQVASKKISVLMNLDSVWALQSHDKIFCNLISLDVSMQCFPFLYLSTLLCYAIMPSSALGTCPVF